MSKHTPGPWNSCCNRCGYIFGDNGNVYVAKLCTAVDGVDPYVADHEMFTANMRLIKASPTLFDACNFVKNWLSSFSMPPTTTNQEKQFAIDVLDSAINMVEPFEECDDAKTES